MHCFFVIEYFFQTENKNVNSVASAFSNLVSLSQFDNLQKEISEMVMESMRDIFREYIELLLSNISDLPEDYQNEIKIGTIDIVKVCSGPKAFISRFFFLE